MPSACHILFEDDAHAVVLKPAGMAMHGKGAHTLTSHLRRHWSADGSAVTAVHRLDYGTRGPVLVAKSDRARKHFQAHWDNVSKTYHAWVAGRLDTHSGFAAFRLEGKVSRTDFRCLGHRSWGVHGQASLVEWSLQSGRTHQIRRHAAAMGHPVIGDLTYGTPPLYTGHGLHLTCTHLAWPHPETGHWMDLHIAPAKKMVRAVQGTFETTAPSPWLHLFTPH